MPTDYSKIRKLNKCEEVKEAIDAYFENCTKENRPLTISGLGLALGVSRSTLLRYEEEESKTLPKDERECICNTIKQAKWVCERFVEEYLFTGKNTMAAIFNLKNNYKEWKDKSGIELESPVGGLEIKIVKPKDDGSEN